MKALVTGAGGFLGMYITEQLVARGDRVRAYSRQRYDQLDALGVDQWTGDLTDVDRLHAACAGIDVVFHVAAVAGIWGPWHHYYTTNTLGTYNVVAGCLKHHVPRLVFTSSPSVTFDGTDQQGVDETAPYPRQWLAHYPHSKALAEQHVLATNGVGGLSTCALRPHLVWGPRDPHLVPRLIQRARAGRLRRVGDGTNRIDTVYVENAATAHLQAADALRPDSPLAGRAYFISQGEPVVCWDWINEILAMVHLPPVRRSISLPAAKRIGRICEAVYGTLGLRAEPPMTRFLAAQLGTSHWFDIRRAREDFGYSPQVSQKEGMARLGKWLNNASAESER